MTYTYPKYKELSVGRFQSSHFPVLILATNYFSRMHIETVHMKLEKYCCPICDEKFVTQHQMEVHRDKIHDGLTEWMCNLCGAKLASRHQYNAHMKRHSMSEVKVSSRLIFLHLHW